eukprot:jgi/Astpho2/615/Aster-04457
MLQDNSDSNLKALDDSPHHISEAVSQELSRDGEASVADIEGSAAPGSTRLHPGDRPIEAEALPLEEASKLPAEPLPSEPWADLEVGLHHQHGNTAGAADQQQQGHWEGRDKRQQLVTLSADEAEQARQRASLAEEARKTIQQARNSLSEAASDRSSSVDSAVSDQLSERMRRQSQALRLSSSEIRRLAISERDSAEEQAARHLLQEEEPKARQEARLIAMKERAEVAASLAEAQAMQSMAEQPGSQMDQLTEEIARIKRAEQALIDAEDAEQMAAELYVLERQLSSLRHSVPAEVADAAQEAKRQAKATVHQAMSKEAGEDVSECAAAGSGLDEPASSGASDTSAFSGITDALLSNPKFSAGAEGGREERQGSDRCQAAEDQLPPKAVPLVKSEAQTQPGQRQQQEASQWSTAESGEGAATIRAAGVADDEGANALADPADNNEAAPIVVAHAEDAEEAPAADASSSPPQIDKPPPDMPRPYGTRDQNGPVPFTEPEEFAGMLYHDGVDSLGRPVVVVDVDAVSSAVPVRKAAMHYLLERLEPIVIQGPYVLVMVSTGRSGSAKSKQLPALWFVSAYRGLSRPFKKNVKYVVLVRPTGWLKTLLAVVRPVTSRKSARKLKKLDSLSQLAAATNNEVTLQHLGTRFAAACGDFILQGLPSGPASQPFREGITYAMPNF